MAIINGRGRVGIRRPSVAAIPSIVSDGLKMYLNAGNATSYAGTGTAWTDLSGNGNGGTLVGGAVYSSASGGSISFDGGNDYANLGAAAYFNGLTDITLNFWVLPQTSAAQRIIFSRYNNGTLNGFMVFHDTDNKFYFDGRESNAQYLRVGTLNTYAVDSWHNVTVTKSGNSWKIYINGVLENSATLGLGNVAWLMQNGAQIGAIFQGNGSQIYGKSNVAVAMAYSRALSAAEVLQNYDALKLRFVPLTYSIVSDSLAFHLDAGNVKSYYGTGTAWKDLSGNGNNVALTNGPAYNSANGGSILFDGINDFSYKSTFPQMNSATVLTISCWCTFGDTGVSRYLLSFGQDGGVGGNFALIAYGFSSIGGGNVLFEFGSGNGRVICNTPRLVNTWYNIVITTDGTTGKMYLNGVLNASSAQGAGRVSSNAALNIGAYGAGTSYFHKGNISNVQIYSRALSAAEIAQNYNATLSRFYPAVSDSDAQAFVVAAGLTSSVQASAVNTLVTSMKTAGIWTKMKAVYPFVGGSAASHKFNLKDPRDDNAAFRLTFGGTGWVHSSTGAKPNGSGDYADTFLIPNVVMSTGGDHLSYYSRTNSSGDVDYLISGESGPPYTFLGIVGKRNSVLGANGRGFYATSNPTSIYQSARQDNSLRDTRGFFVGMSDGSNSYYILNNSILATNTTTNTYVTRLINKLYIAGFPVNNVIAANGYTNKECAFASIGNGLTTAEASSLYDAVQAYQTALGRQV